MTTHGWIALATLVGAAVLFLTRKLPIGVTALSVPVVLYLTGVIQLDEALSGFSNPAVIAIGAVFVVGAGLEESGVAGLIARGIQRLGGSSEVRLLLVVCFAVAGLSAFMSNAATVAVLAPSVVALARRVNIPLSRLMMPLGFSAILGGNLTLIGTASNMLLSDLLEAGTGRSFGMFDFAIVGGPIVVAGILFMVLGRGLLRDRSEDGLGLTRSPQVLAKNYGLTRTIFPMRVTPQSPLAGRTLGEAKIGQRYHLSVVIIMRPGNIGNRYIQPTSDFRIHAGDHLYLDGSDEDAWLLAENEELQIGLAGQHNVERLLRHGTTFAEATIGPGSQALGKSIREVEFRGRHGLNVVSLWRRGKPVNEGLASTPLELGDFLLVSGPPGRIRRFARGTDFIVMTQGATAAQANRWPLALALLLVAVLPPIFHWLPLAISSLLSACLMVATRCVSLGNVARSIDWTVLLLIVGTIPLGDALGKTGVAAQASTVLLASTGGMGEPALLSLLFLVAAVVSVTSSNTAAAVILAPIALAASDAAGLSAETTLLAVAYGCSCAFIVPFANQCNLMVMGPGGYRTKDFVVTGGLLTVVVMATAIAGLVLLG